MLTADTSKRMTMNELLKNHWINHGQKIPLFMIGGQPSGIHLTEDEHKDIFETLHNFGIEKDQVLAAIEKNKFSGIAGN